MKKYIFGVLAIVLGIGLSAFTPSDKKAVNYYWYRESTSSFVLYSGGQACPDGAEINCIVTDVVGNPSEQLYKTESFSQPLKYND